MDRSFDIYSKSEKYPEAELSNFYPHSFTIDGVECASMEGFLQALKYRSVRKQAAVCRLTGMDAKLKGKHKFLWKLLGRVWWQGTAYKRNGEELNSLVRRAYATLYSTNASFRAALDFTAPSRLSHSIGSHDRAKTILTEEEFIGHLTAIRDKEITQ